MQTSWTRRNPLLSSDEEAERKESSWGLPGSGDGLIELTVRRVSRVSSSRYSVTWTRYDEQAGGYVDDVEPSAFSEAQMAVLRRTAPEQVFADVDLVAPPAGSEGEVPAEDGEGPAVKADDEAAEQKMKAEVLTVD